VGPTIAAAILIAVSADCSADAREHKVLDRFSFKAESVTQWRLPNRLGEISGLAMTPGGRLLAVDDEVAVVYELDYVAGGVIKSFAFGTPVVKGDFEGIAVAGDLVYLTTSEGRVYVAAEGADGQTVTFEQYDTKLGENCEIEGLVQSSDNSRLYFLCKAVRKKSIQHKLMLFAWDIKNRELRPHESVRLPVKKIRKQLRVDQINPSAVTIDRHTGNWIVIAARQRVLVEINKQGQLLSATNTLRKSRHRQPEGIELTADGRLLIADEGGRHKARLAVYRQQAGNSEQQK